MKKTISVTVALLGFSLVFFVSGCTHVVVEDRPSDSPVYGKPGPPPWAPAHGYRAKYHYHYYPSCSVYFDLGRNLYFYAGGDRWHVAASLPSGVCLNFNEYVVLDMDTDKPYVWHSHVSKKYPPGQLKKAEKSHTKATGKGKDKWDN